MSIFGLGKKKDDGSNSNFSGKNGNEPSESQDNLSLIEEKKDMIKGIEDLSETSVKEVMIPRIDVDFLSIDTPQEELLAKIAESGHSRFPVYSESIDNVLGILYVKDLLAVISKNQEIDLEKLLRKAYFVPESKKIDGLLREFKRRHIHIAIAVDEYGGVSGVVCMEDIIEEIVGDIQDEFDNEREDILAIGNQIWLCDARVNLEDLNENIKSNFPTEDFDTLGGFVLDLFGRIPVKYEKINWGGFEFIVQDMEGHRVNLIKVIKKAESEEPKKD
ncbi:MAG: hemolysin family protein [Spirochaetales bacterium]|uniref:CBS domain-containing protein n=1 Tax=Treponema berlinense TaxID=225004 RepID=A0A1T4KRU7_9SPIR|nr:MULTISPECIES: hemolysin family protein [Treponema]MDO5766466.1 hemolysin family protein [Spirochaetales bacterium]MBQ9102346.1 HlyC/CorC family transporter [Treponema sp.]MCI5541216.1 hemolysin family protein [Treponema berlinense]MDD5835215.1 hemolysin family protein [Treponema berlinense]MDY3708451.1 hemolysin family protein [Treponema berlinense]